MAGVCKQWFERTLTVVSHHLAEMLSQLGSPQMLPTTWSQQHTGPSAPGPECHTGGRHLLLGTLAFYLRGPGFQSRLHSPFQLLVNVHPGRPQVVAPNVEMWVVSGSWLQPGSAPTAVASWRMTQ